MLSKVYYLKFFLKNISEIKVYKVLENEQERLNVILQNRTERDNTSFFYFDTIDGLSVCISIRDIQAVQMLFDVGISDISTNNQNFNKELYLILRDWNTEFSIDIEDPKEISDLIFNLDSASEDDKNFLSIMDCDGEVNLFNINEIVYIEVGTNIYNEGLELSKED